MLIMPTAASLGAGGDATSAGGLHYGSVPCSPARRAACASPRMLGDVPLLLSEQERWKEQAAPAHGATVAWAMAVPRVAPPSPLSVVQQHAAAVAAATAAVAAGVVDRRTRNGSAGLSALQGGSSCASLARSESFGADSKFGFDQPPLGSGVFMMEEYD
jgi:hypothetical protein